MEQMQGILLLLLLTTMVDIWAAAWMFPSDQTYDRLLIPSQVAPLKSRRSSNNARKGTSLWKPRFFGEFEYASSLNSKWWKSSSCLETSFYPDGSELTTQNSDDNDNTSRLPLISSTQRNCDTDKVTKTSRKQEAMSTNTKNRQAKGKRKRRKLTNKKKKRFPDKMHGYARFGNLPDIEW